MTKYFGFIPSDVLKQKIEAVREHQASGEKDLYRTRDIMLLQMVDEQIDKVLTELISFLPTGDKKNTLEKMTKIVNSTASTMLKQILGKATNDEIQPSLDFIFSQGLIVDNDGQERVAYVVSDKLYSDMEIRFAEVFAGNGEQYLKEVELFFNDFTDQTVHHYLHDMAATLNLGFIKRKAVSIAESAISKGVKMGNKNLFPGLCQTEIENMSTHYQQCFFEK